MTHSDAATWRIDDGIGHIVLARPNDGNAINISSGHSIANAIHAVLDSRPRAVLLTAQGRAFCVGGDVGTFASAGDNFTSMLDELIGLLHPAIQRLATAPLPVVCAIGGAVAGAGIGLALCADVVLAARSMKLRTGYASIGLSPDLGTSIFLLRRIGAQRAKQWLMLSDAVDAQRCLEAGAVDEVLADEALEQAAEERVKRLAALPRGSVASIKTLCDAQPPRTLEAHLALERQLLLQAAGTADAREGVAAFLQKRSPKFTG